MAGGEEKPGPRVWLAVEIPPWAQWRRRHARSGVRPGLDRRNCRGRASRRGPDGRGHRRRWMDSYRGRSSRGIYSARSLRREYAANLPPELDFIAECKADRIYSTERLKESNQGFPFMRKGPNPTGNPDSKAGRRK